MTEEKKVVDEKELDEKELDEVSGEILGITAGVSNPYEQNA
jgi:bacteriocin-like protein